MKADNLLAGGRSQRFFPPLSASGNLSLLCLLNTSQGENSMPSSTPFFRRLLVVIKQTAYEEYSQIQSRWLCSVVGTAQSLHCPHHAVFSDEHLILLFRHHFCKCASHMTHLNAQHPFSSNSEDKPPKPSAGPV
eukprot:scaffold14603_cov214-Alexandrium_tamarense.AAC.5